MITKSKALRRAIINSVVLVIFYIFSSQFFATFWILILPVGFFVILFFAIAAGKNILFWTKNKTAVNNPWLPLLIQAFAVLIAFLIPSNERSKQYHLQTFRLADNEHTGCPCNLYVEYYSAFKQGALGTGLNSEYLTDSLHFRKFLGVYDEGKMPFKITCHGDTITTQKTEDDVPEYKTYSLKYLKEERVSD